METTPRPPSSRPSKSRKRRTWKVQEDHSPPRSRELWKKAGKASSLDPEVCISLLVTKHDYAALYNIIKNAPKDWLKGFLEQDGLGLLLDSLNNLSSLKSVSATCALLQCSSCLRLLANSPAGLKHIISNPDHVKKCLTALQCGNNTVKLQVFELFCALCLSSEEGHTLVLDAFQTIKVSERGKNGSGLGWLVGELKDAETNEYRATLMAFVNCLVLGTSDIKDRFKLRNRLMVSGLHSVINLLECFNDPKLQIQLKVFQDKHKEDLEVMDTTLDHHVLFDKLYQQVADTPYQESLRFLLYNLTQLGNADNERLCRVWTSLELISKNLPERPPVKDNSTQTLMENDPPRSNSSMDGSSPSSSPPPPPPPPPPLPPSSSLNSSLQPSTIPSPPPPPPPPLPSSSNLDPPFQPSSIPPPPPPPPLPLQPSSTTAPPPPPPLPPSSSHPPLQPSTPTPPPPPPPTLSYSATLPTRRTHNPAHNPKYNTLPYPKKKMRTINWTIIPSKTISKKTIWSDVIQEELKIDYSQVEELFCQKTAPRRQLEVRPKSATVNLLEPKRSLAVNILLKQFKQGPEQILSAIASAAPSALSCETLRALVRLLPLKSELALIKEYTQNPENLGSAEQFYLKLSQIPDYALRIQAMLQREECPVILREIEPQLELLLTSCKQLKLDDHFKQFLAMILQLGNYLNAGSYAGNAMGFTLSTLPKLLETRSNKPGMTFLHYVVGLAASKGILAFTTMSQLLNSASKITLSELEGELNSLASDVHNLEKQLKSGHPSIKSQFSDFVKASLKDIQRLRKMVNQVKEEEKHLAVHFCEEPKNFRLEECFTFIADAFHKIIKADQENKAREAEEARGAARRVSVGGKKGSRKVGVQQEICLVDILMREIREGQFKLRRSIPTGQA